jgi:hypothetical protein
VIVGGAGQVMVRFHRHFPRLTEALLSRTAFRGQKTSERKGAKAADTLGGPVQDARLRGSDSARARRQRRILRIGATALSALALTALSGTVVRRLIFA